MPIKSLRVAMLLCFLMLMGQEACQTSPSANRPGRGGDVASAQNREMRSRVPGDLGPSGSVTCGSAQNTFQCMMCNCHLEAGNQSYQGKVAVNKVVMTRVGMSSYPNSVCGVIYQRAQFSWTNTRATRNRTISGANYANCYNSVVEAYNFRGHYASHYHANYVSPGWRRRCTGRFQIGAHYFYRSCGGQRPAPGNSDPAEAVAYLTGQEESTDALQCTL